MNLDAELFPVWVIALSFPLYGAALGASAVARPWQPLRENALIPVFFAAVAGVAGLWSMSVGIHPGLELHMLGATLLTLLFGWRLALLATALALLAVTAAGLYDWGAVGLNGLLLGVLPVAFSFWLGGTVYRWLPRHLFIYVFAVAFFGSMAVLGVVVTASAALLFGIGAYPLETLGRDYLAMLPMILFPEGFVTGMIMTLLVVYRPDWVRTFDDRDYIDGK